MNDLQRIASKEIAKTHLNYGLSSLHCWIRFFELILHIGYKIHIQKWQAKTQEDKESVKSRKSKKKSILAAKIKQILLTTN